MTKPPSRAGELAWANQSVSVEKPRIINSIFFFSGDCDADSDCFGELKCGIDNCPNYFPDPNFDCCYDPPCMAFEYDGIFYLANECRYDYVHENSWCATSIDADGEIEDWKICGEEAPYTNDYTCKF